MAFRLPRLPRVVRAEAVQLATVDVDERIRVREEAPPLIQARLGKKLRLVVPYAFADTSPHHEEFRVSFAVRVDKGEWQTDEAQHQTGGRRTADGRLSHPLRYLSAGDRTVEYRLRVEHEVRPESGHPLLTDRKEVSGRLTLRVGRSDIGTGPLGVGA